MKSGLFPYQPEYLLSLSAESWRADRGTASSYIDLSSCALLSGLAKAKHIILYILMAVKVGSPIAKVKLNSQ